jgi:hypothetical protein
MDDTDKLLEERGKAYGSYHELSKTAQALKDVFRSKDDWLYLLPEERESIDLICTKLARLLHGGGDKSDTLHDIAGYARLAAKRSTDGAPGSD